MTLMPNQVSNLIALLIVGHLLPIQESVQGIFYILFSRVPKAKSFVNDPVREKELGWGDINKRMPDSSYQILKGLALNFLNTRRRLFVVDGFAGWDP